MGTRRTVRVDGADLAVSSAGTGESLLVVSTALAADELEPLAAQPVIADHHRIITYDRRGYGASTSTSGPGSIVRDATDAAMVLGAFGTTPAHVLGASYSAAVALELAAAHPERVRSLVLLEPPPVDVVSGGEFRAACQKLLQLRRRLGVDAALETFMEQIAGPAWRETYEATVPGMVGRIERDAGIFFDSDVPAILGWRPDRSRLSALTCPVLYVGGSASGPWFAEVRDWVSWLLPRAHVVMVQEAGHDLALTHPQEVAEAFGAFRKIPRETTGR